MFAEVYNNNNNNTQMYPDWGLFERRSAGDDDDLFLLQENLFAHRLYARFTTNYDRVISLLCPMDIMRYVVCVCVYV